MVILDYRDSRPIYVQIADGIREQIVTGILMQGDRLPSVRELATELTINPNTIQRAYRELETQGWITSVGGKGCFVSGVPFGNPEEQAALLREFDRITQQLLAQGVDQRELALRIEKGGKSHA